MEPAEIFAFTLTLPILSWAGGRENFFHACLLTHLLRMQSSVVVQKVTLILQLPIITLTTLAGLRMMLSPYSIFVLICLLSYCRGKLLLSLQNVEKRLQRYGHEIGLNSKCCWSLHNFCQTLQEKTGQSTSYDQWLRPGLHLQPDFLIPAALGLLVGLHQHPQTAHPPLAAPFAAFFIGLSAASALSRHDTPSYASTSTRPILMTFQSLRKAALLALLPIFSVLLLLLSGPLGGEIRTIPALALFGLALFSSSSRELRCMLTTFRVVGPFKSLSSPHQAAGTTEARLRHLEFSLSKKKRLGSFAVTLLSFRRHSIDWRGADSARSLFAVDLLLALTLTLF